MKKEKLASEEIVRLANEAKETVIREKNETETTLKEAQELADKLKSELTEKVSENNELNLQIENKDKQIEELQNSNNLFSAEIKIFLENYQEYLQIKVKDTKEALIEEIFNEEQKQEIVQEKQEYEAKIVQVEQFIGKVNK